MKNQKKSFVSRARMLRCALFTFVFAGCVAQSQAAITFPFTLVGTSGTLDANLNLGSGTLNNWQVGGQNQLVNQWFYYNVGSPGPASSIDSMSSLGSVSTNFSGAPPKVKGTYTQTGLVQITPTFVLNGNTLSDTIQVKNVSGATQTIYFYQYSDFDLGNAPGSQTVNMFPISGTQAEVDQSGGGVTLQTLLQPVSGGTMLMQADNGGALFGPMNGSGTSLDNTTLSASGNAVFAIEWYATLANNASFTISENQIITVPEPTTLALISSGILALGWLHRRRRVG